MWSLKTNKNQKKELTDDTEVVLVVVWGVGWGGQYGWRGSKEIQQEEEDAGRSTVFLTEPSDSSTQLNIPFLLKFPTTKARFLYFPNFILRCIRISYLSCLLVFLKYCQIPIPRPFCTIYKQFHGFSSNSEMLPKYPEKQITLSQPTHEWI